MRLAKCIMLSMLCVAGGDAVLFGQELPAPALEPDYGALEREYPLHWVLNAKNYDEALRLIPLTPDLNAVDLMGRTPLTIAAADESADAFDMVEALLRMGADQTIADADGLLPLHYAAAAGTLSVVHLLVDGYSGAVNVRPEKNSPYFEIDEGLTPLRMAYREGRSRVAKFLELRGARLPEEIAGELNMKASIDARIRERLGENESKLAGLSEDEANDMRVTVTLDAIRNASIESGITTEQQAMLDELLAHLYNSRNDPVPEGMSIVDWVVQRAQRAAAQVSEEFGSTR